jgi:hypothetical protein
MNEHLDPANPALYAQAQAVVANAHSCRDAVEGIRAAGGPLGAAPANAVDAATDVLAALPPALDQAILGAARNGLSRSIAVYFDEWDEQPDISIRVVEEMHQGAARVRIVISHPHDGRQP